MEESKGPILFVMVIGFHHKKGCQVEYSFPPLPEGANECPSGWKYLPTLALPDGSHNYDEDTVFFHLPSLTHAKTTVFGISCFRQIAIEKIKNRTADITRGTVQKSVCVLSKIPLYGQIQVKMSLITHAYFEEGDFSKVSILEDTYHHLNDVFLHNDTEQQIFVGLSARDFVLQWKHKAVLLFKLLLLEKRVLFFKSPVLPLCSTILTLCSLIPEMIERGLHQSACIRLSRPMSPMPHFSDEDSPVLTPPKENVTLNAQLNLNVNGNNCKSDIGESQKGVEVDVGCQIYLDNDQNVLKNSDHKYDIENGVELSESTILGKEDSNNSAKDNSMGEKSSSLRRDVSVDTISDNMQNLTHLVQIPCGFPLAVFSKGSLCLPYLSLSYLDILSDVNVRSYIVGTTNVLFKQKRQLWDILVDIDSYRIECQDPNLRKYLHLTTEDLRFADYLVKHVSEEKHDVFLDGVGYEGGDEWVRAQFKIYLMCLMRTSLLQDGAREIENFNSSFVTAWRETHNYKMWLSGINPDMLSFHAGHPFAGQLSVADLRNRIAHTMQNSDSGRKINQAVTSTGRAVASTSKAVGGAISHAKGALSSWWSNLMVTPETNLASIKPPTESICSESCLEEADGSKMVEPENSNDNLINNPESIPENSIINNKVWELNGLSKLGNSESDDIMSNNEVDHRPGEVYTV